MVPFASNRASPWWAFATARMELRPTPGAPARLECLTKLKGNESNRKGKEGRMDICPPLITNE